MSLNFVPTVYNVSPTTRHPQHILHNIYFVIHNIHPTTYPFLYVVGCMLWMTSICCGLHVPECCPQHIHVVHKVYICCGRRLSFCSLVAHNIHPQYITVSTTYTHRIYILISCGCMLWITSTYVVDHTCYTYVVDYFEFYRCSISNICV